MAECTSLEELQAKIKGSKKDSICTLRGHLASLKAHVTTQAAHDPISYLQWALQASISQLFVSFVLERHRRHQSKLQGDGKESEGDDSCDESGDSSGELSDTESLAN